MSTKRVEPRATRSFGSRSWRNCRSTCSWRFSARRVLRPCQAESQEQLSAARTFSSKEEKMAHRTEELASKAAGAMKTAKAAFKGLTGVFKVLTREHGEASALLMRVKMSSDVRVRSELFPKIRAELMVHEKGELREVYPVFMQHPELENIAKDHQREAGELQSLLDGLSALPYDNAAWEQGFASLVELVGQHTKQEENEYFPLANRVLGHAEIERLQSQYETAKAEVMQKLSVGDGR